MHADFLRSQPFNNPTRHHYLYPMPPSGGRRIKSESVKCGLITPARTLTPKVEIDLTESDSSEELAQLPQFKSPVRLSVEDEGYASRVAERQPSRMLFAGGSLFPVLNADMCF